MAHLNDRGQPCNCGFGRFQPQLGWHMGAAKVVEENNLPSYVEEEGRPFIYDPDENTVVMGPEGGIHWHLIEAFPTLEEHPNGRLNPDHTLDWFVPPIEGQAEAEEALGAKAVDHPASGWTVPTPTEPDPEERHHEVEISNDEYGVPTIDA